ncbi:hypothetical protein M0R45_033038 [Rubus argutus]|uniref:Uncharacterized protein n=1 Tax=Rubus argutus TaxID=59490 RepID=A0AAW1WIJ6_RUBAR
MATALSCGQTILISPPSTFTSRYKDVNLRRLTKPNRVACKFNLKPLPTFSTSRPPNQVLPILPRGLSGLDLSAASSTLLSGNESWAVTENIHPARTTQIFNIAPIFSIPALAHTLFTVEGRYKPF